MRSSWMAVLSAIALVALSACGSSGAPAPSEPDPAPAAAGGSIPSNPPPPPSAPPPAAPPPEPLGPVGEWKWIDVPGAVCGYGQNTGFEVNVGTGSDVLLYLEGGGLCWDEVSCQVGSGGTALAHNFTLGYTEETFKKGHEGGLTNREQPNNPFKDATIVYIPYCTGDFHAGSATRDFPNAKQTAHWAGKQNLELYLAKIVPALANASRVTLAGSSAGGFGALINFWRVQEAFGHTRVDMISDSSPALWSNAVIFSGLAAWNTGPALPPDCPECSGNLRALYAYYATHYPNSRLAVTTNSEDEGMSLGGYTLTPFPQFYQAIHDLTVNTLKPLPNLKYFVADGTHHPLMDNLDSVSQPTCCTAVLGFCLPRACGTAMTLGDWITKMKSDDPSWTNQTSLIE